MLVQSEMIVVESFVSAEETWAEWSRGIVAVGVGAGAGVAVGGIWKGGGGGGWEDLERSGDLDLR